MRLLSVIGFVLFALAACAPTQPNLRALTKQAAARGAACGQAVARFAAAPGGEMRRDVLGQLKELNTALIETAGYAQEARRTNSVDLIGANRAFLETGRAWTSVVSHKFIVILRSP